MNEVRVLLTLVIFALATFLTCALYDCRAQLRGGRLGEHCHPDLTCNEGLACVRNVEARLEMCVRAAAVPTLTTETPDGGAK